jgi:hypothetical protein
MSNMTIELILTKTDLAAGYSPPTPTPVMPLAMVMNQNMPCALPCAP